MRGIFSLIVLSLLALGCAGGGVGGVTAGGRTCCYGIMSDKLHYMILTDGRMGSFGVANYIIGGNHYSGAIYPATAALGEIAFRANSRNVWIGMERFQLHDGNIFIVSTASEQLAIKQINLPVKQQIHGFIAANPELNSFCSSKTTAKAQ